MIKRTFHFSMEKENGDKHDSEIVLLENMKEISEHIKSIIEMPFEKDKVINFDTCALFGEYDGNKIFKLDNNVFMFHPVRDDKTGNTNLLDGIVRLAKKNEDGTINTFPDDNKEDYCIIFDKNNMYAGLQMKAEVRMISEETVNDVPELKPFDGEV